MEGATEGRCGVTVAPGVVAPDGDGRKGHRHLARGCGDRRTLAGTGPGHRGCALDRHTLWHREVDGERGEVLLEERRVTQTGDLGVAPGRPR